MTTEPRAGSEPLTERVYTTAGLQAKVRLRRAWFEAHPNQPVGEGRKEVDELIVAIQDEAILDAEPLNAKALARVLPAAVNFYFLPPRVVDDPIWRALAEDIAARLTTVSREGSEG